MILKVLADEHPNQKLWGNPNTAGFLVGRFSLVWGAFGKWHLRRDAIAMNFCEDRMRCGRSSEM